MATVPSLAELVARARSRLASALGSDSRLAIDFGTVLGTVLGGSDSLLYRYGAWAGQQGFASLASSRTVELNGRRLVPLEQHGIELGVGARSATRATRLRVTVTVTTQGGTIQDGRQLQSSDGVLYALQGELTLDADTVTATVQDVSGSGADGNQDVGAELTWLDPLAGVARTVTVASTETTGRDVEEWPPYRAKVLERKQRPLYGGASADMREWGLTVEGVTGVFPYRSATPGQSDVYVATDAADRLPTAQQLADVEAAIWSSEGGAAHDNIKPAVQAVSVEAFDVEINALASVEDEAATKAAVAEALEEWLLSRAPYIPGLSVGQREDTISDSAVSGVVQGIVSTDGGTVGAVKVYDSGGSAVDVYALGHGELAVLQEITWQ